MFFFSNGVSEKIYHTVRHLNSDVYFLPLPQKKKKNKQKNLNKITVKKNERQIGQSEKEKEGYNNCNNNSYIVEQ